MIMARPIRTSITDRCPVTPVKDLGLRLRIRLALRYPLPASLFMFLPDRKLRLDQSRFQRTRSEVHHRHLRSRRESQATPPCQHGMLRGMFFIARLCQTLD